MIRILIDLAIIYVYCSFIGAAIYQLIVPTYLRTTYFAMVLPAGLGFATLAIVGAYVLLCARPINDVLTISVALGAAAYLIYAFLEIMFRKRSLSDLLRLSRWKAAIVSLLRRRKVWLSVLLFAVLYSPVLRANIPTTPFRIGVDQAGYAEAAQFLVEHGSVLTIRASLLRQLGTDDLRKAKAQNLKALNFGTYVDSEFLLKALRLGFPATVAALTILTHSRHVFEIEFIMLIFNYALLVTIIYFSFRVVFEMAPNLSFALAFAFAFNCNVLNVIYEGQLAQVFVYPYFTLCMILYLFARKLSARMNRLTLLSLVRPAALFAFLLATLFCAYNESIVLLLGLLCLVTLLDAAFYRRTTLVAALFLLIATSAGALIAWPLSKQWIAYSFANLGGLARAGFWQPHWGSFAEILGLFNMYGDLQAVLLDRTFYNAALNLVISSLLALALVVYFISKRSSDRSFWLAPPLAIAAAYFQMHSLHPILNYPYMKIYTMLLPLTFCAVFAALGKLPRGRASGLIFASYVAIAAIAISGLTYIAQYMRDGSYVTRDMFALYRYDGARRFDRDVLLVPKRDSPIAVDRSLMLIPIVSMNWIDADYNGPRVIAPYLDYPVLLLLTNHALSCRWCFIRQFGNRIAYQNGSFVVYRTGLRVRQFCVREARRYTLSSLSYSSLDRWDNLPVPQCDFQRFDSLQKPWQS